VCEPGLRRAAAAALDLQEPTFTNTNAAERLFWRNTMVPEMAFLEEQLTEKLIPCWATPICGWSSTSAP